MYKTPVRTNKNKSLLIDDDPSSRLLITEILEGANVNIIECGCGNEAISLFRLHRVEIVLVLLDIKLSDCSGWELLHLFRLEKPEVPAIAISAIPPTELSFQHKTAGFNAYLSKPFDMDEFLTLVRPYL
jgi:CheY-like chemotaxis protein